MKPKIITAILLFISAYAPLFIILAVKDFDFDCTKNFKHSTPIFILLGLTLISLGLLFYSVKSIQKGNMPLQLLMKKETQLQFNLQLQKM